MMLQPAVNNVQRTRSANKFTFTDSTGITKIVFFPQSLMPSPVQSSGGSQLDYQGLEGQFIFSGNEIDQQRSLLGSLISVTLKPNLDAGGLDFTLLLPPVNLGEQKRQEFETVAIKTKSQGRVINPVGAELTYEVLNLKGVAENVILPFGSTSNQKVLEVNDINLVILESFPTQLQISVFGTVSSAGWSNPQLMPYSYIQAPPDGIYDFDFVATPPQEPVALIISPIRVKTVIPAEGIKGIRVHASLNSKEVILN